MILKTVIQQVISTLDKRSMSKYLLLDGTSWEFGKTKFHFLTLSIVYQGISLPIFFINLAKKGVPIIWSVSAFFKWLIVYIP
jgi:hypothetical protein